MRSGIFILLFFLLSSAYSQDCLSLLDSVYYYKSTKPPRSKEFALKLTERLDSAKCHEEIGYPETYNQLALIYWQLNEQQQAFDAVEKAITHNLKSYDSLSPIMVPYYQNIIAFYKESANYVMAKKYLDISWKATNANIASNSETFCERLVEKAILLRELGMFSESKADLQQALTTLDTEQINNDSLKGVILIESGTLHTLLGNYSDAEQELDRALSILRANFPQLQSKAIDRLAKLKLDQGDFSASESELLSNINFKTANFPEDSLLLVESINNLGLLYFRFDLENARKYFKQLEQIGRKYPVITPYTTNNLAVIDMKYGRLQEAEQGFIKSRELFYEMFGPIHPDYANCLNNLAGVYAEEGKLEDAMALYMKVLDLDRLLYGVNHQKYATTLSNLASIYKQLGYSEMALSFYIQSANIRKESLGPDHHLYAKNLNDIGLMHLTGQDTLAALESFDQGLKILIDHLHDVFPVLTERQRVLFYEEIRFDLRRFLALAFNSSYFETEWAEKALNYYINTKSIIYYAADKLRRAVQNSVDPAIRSQYNAWRDTKFELAKAYLLSAEEKRLQHLSIQQLEEKSQTLEKELSLSFRSFSNQNETQFITWNDISLALEDSTVLIEVIEYNDFLLDSDSIRTRQGFVDESLYVAFFIYPSGKLERVAWPKDAHLVRQYSFYKNALKYNVIDSLSYSKFWEPIDREIGVAKKLYLAADGIWHKINPAILYIPDEKIFVAEKHHIVHLTSGKDLLIEKQTLKTQTASLFGNPDFTSIRSNVDLMQLPGAELEAVEVRQVLQKNGWEINTHLNEEATEENLKLINNNDLIHVATHGYFLEHENEDPLLNSGLYLSTKEGYEDGILSAYEAMNLNLDATNLVVLSACETGLGEVQNGEGVFGLERAFLVAGAENLIISLVKVDDQATREFMSHFYGNLTDGLSVEDAFFSARSTFKRDYPNPYYWGAFILTSKH